MGQTYIMNARRRIIDKIDEKLSKIQGLEKKLDFLRDVVYEIIEVISDETELEQLEKTFEAL